MPGTVHVLYLGKSSQQPCEVGIIIIPILQIRKVKHREASYSRLDRYYYSMFESSTETKAQRCEVTYSRSHKEAVSKVELETTIAASKSRVLSVAPQLSPTLFSLMEKLKQMWPILSKKHPSHGMEELGLGCASGIWAFWGVFHCV